MIRPELMEAYARRLAASIGSDLGAAVTSIRRTMFDCQGAEVVVEWLAKLEDGSEVRLSAVVTRGRPEIMPAEPSREEMQRLRELGISPEASENLGQD
ncbi:MAG TPA: hypothetical protein VHC97_16050 [Thermoanaerobaculia bacterium]|jgi:hypothetical protein|nr:hypothetical protein [Thermoanaerobaculia bacterium]